MNSNEQIFSFRIILMVLFIFSLILSIQSPNSVFDLGSFALGIACPNVCSFTCNMLFPWLTKNGVALGIVIGIITVFFTEQIGQVMFGNLINWEKWPLTIHSAFGEFYFNFISAVLISFITQDTKKIIIKIKFMNSSMIIETYQ